MLMFIFQKIESQYCTDGPVAGELPAHGASEDRTENFRSSPGTVLIYCNKDQEEIPHAN
jgi:hypothetical protein